MNADPDLEGDLAPAAPVTDVAADVDAGAELDAPPADAPPADLAPAEPLTLPPTLPPTGDPTMNDTKQALALEAKQLEKSIADAKAAGQSARAEALEARRQRVLARVSA